MKLRKIVLLLTLTLLFIGLSYATEVSNDTTNHINTNIHSTTKEVVQNSNTTIKEIETTSTEKTKKEITKQNNNPTIKTDYNNTYTITVTNSQELINEFVAAKNTTYDTYTINYQKGEYDSDYIQDVYNLTWGKSKGTKTLILDGNGINFVGKDTNHFLTIDSGYNFILKNVTLSNFYNNNGGAIYCGGNLTIYDSTFNSNRASGSGGAIYCGGNLTIYDSTFESNRAYYGGAIYGTDIFTYNSYFRDNEATYRGGAIYTLDFISIENSSFVSNVADCGGALYASNIYIYKGSFIDNHLYNSTTSSSRNRYGGAIYGITQITIKQSIFRDNYIGYKSFNLRKNITIYDDKYGGAIYCTCPILIQNTSFYDNEVLGYSNTGTYQVISADGKYYTIYGFAVNSRGYGGAIYSTGDINISGSEFKYNYAYNYYGSIYGNNTFIYDSVFNENRADVYGIYSENDMDIINSKFKNNICGDYFIRAGNTWSSITVNDCEFDNNRRYAIYVPYITVYNSKFNNNKIDGSSVSVYNSTFNTNITLTASEVKYDINDIITLKISLRNQNNEVLDNKNITVQIASETFSLLTDDEGEATLDYLVNSSGNIKIIISYNGTPRTSTYEAILTIPKKIANITLNTITDTLYSNNVTIQGKLTDMDNVALSNQDIKIIVNENEEYYSKTNNNGYNLSIPALNTGFNKITAIFEGNDLYDATNVSTTFNVMKKGTEISLNTIPDSTYNSIIVVKGKLTDSDKNVLEDQNVTIKINNQEFVTKTDENGVYSYEYATQTLGINNISVLFVSDNYNFSNITKSFIVNKKDTLLNINPIDDNSYANQIILTGKLTDLDGNIIQDANLTINYNSKPSQVQSDINGSFNYELSDRIIGQNNVKIMFLGNSYYNPTNQSIVFNTRKSSINIILDTILEQKIGDLISINGFLKDDNSNMLSYKTVTFNINGEEYQAFTDNYGKFSLEYTVKNIGINNIIITVNGSNFYDGATISTIFVVDSKDTSISINKIDDTYLGDTVVIRGRLIDEYGNLITDANINININDLVYEVKTDNSGFYSMNYTSYIIGSYLISVEFKGNEYFKTTTNSTTFNVHKIPTEILLNTIEYSDKIAITGKLITINNINITNETVKVNVNGETFIPRTDNYGEFIISTQKIVGTNNLTVSYSGNREYNSYEINTTFIVNKKDVIITFDKIGAVCYGDNITLTGKVTDVNEKSLNNINVLITINGKLYKAKTDKTGTYALITTANTMGTNNVTIAYNGNTNYNSFETSTTFQVEKQDIIITYNPIKDTKYKNNITITGKIMDKNEKSLYNINVLITINGKLFKAKTDKTGSFTLITTANNIGTNNVTLGYGGNVKYNSYETSTTFQVEKQDITITYNPIKDTKYKNNITITGKVMDINGRPIYNINTLITINGKLYKAKTDNNGAFILTTIANNIGTNKVTLAYNGNTNYNSYETSTSFNVEKQDIIITYNPIKDVAFNDNITITGRVTDANGKAISNINVLITINDILYKAKTDTTGTYKFTTAAKNIGINNISIGYNGNANYNSFETSTTINVDKQEIIITYNQISQAKKGDNITISGKFTDKNGKAISNTNVNIYINNKLYKAKTDTTGTYILITTAKVIGTNKVTVGYPGNTRYYGYETSTSFYVY